MGWSIRIHGCAEMCFLCRNQMNGKVWKNEGIHIYTNLIGFYNTFTILLAQRQVRLLYNMKHCATSNIEHASSELFNFSFLFLSFRFVSFRFLSFLSILCIPLRCLSFHLFSCLVRKVCWKVSSPFFFK